MIRTKWILAAAVALVATGLFQADSGAGDKKKKKAKQNLAITPMNRDIPRHKQFLKIAEKGGVEVVFIGDSITQGWGNNATWKKHYAPIKAANFGISGDQTGHVLWRITVGKELDTITPKVAVVMIGTNNSGRDSAEQIAQGITLIVKTIHEKTPKTKVLLLGVFPRGEKAGTPIRKKLATINTIVSKLDDGGKTVKYLDIGEKFLEPDGTLSRKVMPDFLHLSAKGYEIWAEAINPTLHDMLK
ncbi:MAG: GDSL family lipase [Planctomycetes bacterium]|nr:GDSL family lipase [Planctomycetota bacterium]